MRKEQFQQCLEGMLGSYDPWPKDLANYTKPSEDGFYHLRLNRDDFDALVIAFRWAQQNIADFGSKGFCVMCGTPLSVTADDNALCDYHLRLKASGLACIWGYEDDDGWEFYCAEPVFKDGYCEHHYARMQETPDYEYEQMVKALDLMRGETDEGKL